MKISSHILNPYFLGTGAILAAGIAASFIVPGMRGPQEVAAKSGSHAAAHPGNGAGQGTFDRMPRIRNTTRHSTTMPATQPSEGAATATQPRSESATTEPAAAIQVPLAPHATQPSAGSMPSVTGSPTGEHSPTTTEGAEQQAPKLGEHGPIAAEPAINALPNGPQKDAATTQPESASPSTFDPSAHMSGDLFGERSKLESRGVNVDLSLTTDIAMILTGGAHPDRGAFGYELNLSIAVDTERLMGVQGGTFFTNFRSQKGLTHSLDGSFGNTSHLDEPERQEVSELWYQQMLLNDKLRIKFGKIDANTDFDHVPHGADFLNDLGAYSATVLGMPTDPDPSVGADATFTRNDSFYISGGVFDGSGLRGVTTGDRGPESLLHSSSSLFAIAEIGTVWKLPHGRDGQFGAGIWDHTGTLPHLDGHGSDHSAAGGYLTFDQVIWKKNAEQTDDIQGIALFALAGNANPRISGVDYQASTGVEWTGPLPGRATDVAGLGIGILHFSHAQNAGFDKPTEITAEVFYRLQITPWCNIQPDLQFIHDASGSNSSRDTVLVTIQLQFDF